MFPLKFVPEDTKIQFLNFRKIGLMVSSAAILISIFLTVIIGLNFGIDFRGGILIELRASEGAIDLAELRSNVGSLALGDTEVQRFDKDSDALIRVETQEGGKEAQLEAVNKIKDKLGSGYEYRRVEVVGPKVSGELIQTGIMAIIIAVLVVLVYIWFRFELNFGVGAVIALVHDVILTIGVFSLFQIEFGLPIIAAILTIIGYSLNDTVVVYDRIRENLRKFKKLPMVDVLNVSLNETLSRTILTSVTTLIALLVLFFFGGANLKGFTFAMIWGVLVGTYSSIFIASPALLFINFNKEDKQNRQASA